ncbi:hypothetical protein L484_014657 [Morus notabilis]|uniref:Uncharacterized protein n=1 Tax=Morus notabilis TaxID=981085 RepID=W9RUW0_9ROSA|nr:hypothetical protein L484_014657 [Morus notabilis]
MTLTFIQYFCKEGHQSTNTVLGASRAVLIMSLNTVADAASTISTTIPAITVVTSPPV